MILLPQQGRSRLRGIPLLAVLTLFLPCAARAQQQPAPRAAAQQPQRPTLRAKKPGGPSKSLTPVEQRIQAVEGRLVPAVRIKGKQAASATLSARMKKYHVPGVSIAVINDYSVEWARSYGAADAATGAGVDTTTLFQAGSAGEPVAALVALRLAQAKKLDLKRDVNRSLKAWKLPKSDFTKNRPVTVRALLAHSAGLVVTELQEFEPAATLPTILQVLSGGAPARPPAIVSAGPPGEAFHASAGDYDVLQQLLTDVTKRPFANLAADSVLEPLGMHHSSFFEPDGAGAPLAASGHDDFGKRIPDKWRNHPELATAGLWSTPRDLALLVLEIQRARSGKPGKVLTAESARQLVTAEHVGWPGLGVLLEGRDQSVRFRASGSTEGYTAELVGYVSRGQGAVVMTNGASGAALAEEILNGIATVYGWPDFVPPEKTIARVDTRIYDRFVGRYTLDSREMSVAKRGTRLFIGPAGKESRELLPESVSEFFTTEPGAFYSFVFDENGKVQAFTERRRFEYTRWDRR
ncbi:MAG: beta-lactamase family protein [Gemmatimonadetes bacterium]|nr:beta-lactamase family protein [Gemmatimonadota bacterium]